jgi:hypothetical protein
MPWRILMRYFTKGWLKAGTSDSWGFSFEFYPRDRSLSIMILHWYFIIEKEYK